MDGVFFIRHYRRLYYYDNIRGEGVDDDTHRVMRITAAEPEVCQSVERAKPGKQLELWIGKKKQVDTCGDPLTNAKEAE